MSELKDALVGITKDRRRFILFRVAGLDKNTALSTADVREKRYKSWLHDPKFVTAHRKIQELHETSREEAMRLIRRDNQMAATLLERDIIERLREEIDCGDYKLVKTHLGREVYSRLMNDLDQTPAIQVNTWEQRILSIPPNEQPKLIGGDIIDADYSETKTSPTEEHTQS